MINEMFPGQIIYMDNLQKSQLPDTISAGNFQVVFIDPTLPEIKKCGGNYIQLISYKVNNLTKSLEINYRVINGGKISTSRMKCGPDCQEYFN